MDTTTIRELVIAAKQMEEILDRNGVNRPDLHWTERIAAAERALAQEIYGTPFTTIEALLLADELSAWVLEAKQNVGNPMKGKAHEYRAKRGLE